MIIKASNILINREIVGTRYITIDNGIITDISESGVATKEYSGTLIPGFVDIHCHGGGGSAFSSKNIHEIERVIATHRSHGTTTQMASLVTEPIPVLKEQITRLKDFVDSGEIAGIHLEGPYLSHEKCGAHDPHLLREPVLREVMELIEHGDGAISYITMAPELPGAIECIEALVERGVVVAIGHSNASAEDARRAIIAGARAVTHFWNAIPKENAPSITSEVFNDPTMVLEIIHDGHHVEQEKVAEILKGAPDRIALITDAMSAAGASDGSYNIGELDVVVKDGVARLVSNGSLAGSTLTMDSAFTRLLREQNQTLVQASYAASTLPAQTLGINYVGEIAVGKAAHFVRIEADEVKEVLRFS
jgi:N-acetylglucosamine-6-phosphate deacetylase